jgi:hypothetical protein
MLVENHDAHAPNCSSKHINKLVVNKTLIMIHGNLLEQCKMQPMQLQWNAVLESISVGCVGHLSHKRKRKKKKKKNQSP